MSCLNSTSSAGNSASKTSSRKGSSTCRRPSRPRPQPPRSSRRAAAMHLGVARRPAARHTPIRLPRSASGLQGRKVVAADERPGRSVAGSRAVDALDDREHGRRVGDVTGHRAGGVLLGGDRDDAGPADEPERRLDADDAVGAGRADDRAVGLGTDRDRRPGWRPPPRPSRCWIRTGCGRARTGCWSGRRGRSSRWTSWSSGSWPTRTGWPCRGSRHRPRAAASRGTRRGPAGRRSARTSRPSCVAGRRCRRCP